LAPKKFCLKYPEKPTVIYDMNEFIYYGAMAIFKKSYSVDETDNLGSGLNVFEAGEADDINSLLV